MQWNIADLPIFTTVVEQGGISNAASQLRMPKSSVSRYISRLEEDLNLRLFERNSRQMRLTQEGEIFYKHAQLIMEQVQAADSHMNGLSETPSGKLTVSLPMGFSRYIVSRHVPEFHRRYPDIQVEYIISSKPVDLIGDHIDVAVQIGDLPDSDYIAVPLLTRRLIWIAHPDMADKFKRVEDLSELIAHVEMCEYRYNGVPLKIKHDGVSQQLTLHAPVETRDMLMVKDAVLDNFGIGLMPSIYCRDELESGQLVEVATNVELLPQAKASAVYTSKRMLNARTRVFIDFLKEICSEYQ